MSEKFCLSPWHHMNINNRGTIKPCCIFTDSKSPEGEENIFDWYANAYNEVKEKGLLHKGCEVCKIAEEKGIPSRREWRGNKGNAKDGEITYLDITFGNTCNLKCRMCESRNSTKWIADEKKLVEGGFDLERVITPKYDMPDYRLDQIVEYCNNITYDDFVLEIKGGEPFVTDQFLNFIDRLDDNFKRNTTLVIFTNGTGISDYYIEKLKPFKKIKCHLSLEATGELYKYIRGGPNHPLETAVKNMEYMRDHIPNFIPSVSITVTMYNIFHLQQMLSVIKQYFGDDNYSKAFGSISYFPAYQDPAHLPNKTKRKLIASYSKEPSFDNIVKWLKTQDRDKWKWKKFKEYTEKLDKIRNEKLFDVEPKFRKIWNEE